MHKNRSDLRVLLLQIRDHEKIRLQEHHTFAAYSKLGIHQIDILNVFDTPQFGAEVLEGYDALYVGGASEASVLQPDEYPFVESSAALLRNCIDLDIPVFASCFGFQLVVVALGGTVIATPENFEMGTIPISLTKTAQEDPLFHDTPNGFLAISCHKEKSLTPPPNCEMLAYTDACCHSFRVKGKHFWAFQFHPEVDRECLIERLTFYKANYTDSDGQLDAVLQAAEETPESNHLLCKFVDRVLLGEVYK